MPTMTLTEFNQNPSRVVRLMEQDDSTPVQVTKRGVPLFQVSPIPREVDPVARLIAAGLARPPAVTSREPIAYDSERLPPGLDLIAELARDRGRLE